MELTRITINNKEYPLYFDLNALEQIQERYKSLDISKKLTQIKEVKWILTLAINEGIAYENYMFEQKNKLLTEKELGLMMNFKDLQRPDLAEAILKAFNGEEQKN